MLIAVVRAHKRKTCSTSSQRPYILPIRTAMISSNLQAITHEVHGYLKDFFKDDEIMSIQRSISLYHDGESVSSLCNRILPFFEPDNFSALRSIRNVVFADDLLQFDCLTDCFVVDKTPSNEHRVAYGETDVHTYGKCISFCG